MRPGLVPAGSSDIRGNRLGYAIVVAIAACLALQAWLAMVMEINWDEFFFLSHLYEFDRGEMTKVLQSFQVHFLGWLVHAPGTEVDQIVVGRLVMLGCQTVTCVLIYSLAREFFRPVASLVAALAFASAGYTIIHGASFRADPLAAALTMLALVALARGEMSKWTLLLAALSAAAAALITIKVVLYAPAFAGIAVWRYLTATDTKQALRWLAATLLALVLAFAAFYVLQLAILPAANSAGSQAILSNAAQTTVVEAGLLPRLQEVFQAALLSPVQTVLLLAGMVGAGVAFAKGNREERIHLVAILSCATPLLCLLFYRNAFPYFFPFIIPPAMLLVAWVIENAALFERRGRTAVIIAAFLAPAVIVAVQWSSRDQMAQRQLIGATHQIFATPVAMIDRNSMVASFPKRGFFMSTWGLRNYRNRGPFVEEALAREPVPLLLLNSPSLEDAVGAALTMPLAYPLLDADRAALRENYIPHWGAIWVAGQSHKVGPEGTEITVKIPGTYTVEGGPAAIDGRQVSHGSIVQLERGRYRLRSPVRSNVTLRWGTHLRRPAQTPPSGPVYRGF